MTLTKTKVDRQLFYNLSWSEFENILEELGENRGSRIAYDTGTLEIMAPLPEHEYYRETIGDSIKEIAEILALDYESLGSTTWRKKQQQAGVEPDNCFYFQNEGKIRGKLDVNLERDPPPDLVLEIDLTSKSLNRLPIYARLGVPELWCYDTGELKIYQLQKSEYVERENSLIFPQLVIKELPQLIEYYRTRGRRALRQGVRNWVQKQL